MFKFNSLPILVGGAALGAIAFTALPSSASALHGYCAQGAQATAQCQDNNTNSPTANNPPQDFGFAISGNSTSTGDVLIDILIPNNEDSSPSALSFSLTGTVAATASLVSTTAYANNAFGLHNNPKFPDYLNAIPTTPDPSNASPANPLNNYLTPTQVLDPGATGFYVYQANLGSITLPGNSNNCASCDSTFSEDLSSSLALASHIVAFQNQGTSASPNWAATANSGGIFETTPAPPIGQGLPVALAVGGLLLGFKLWERGQRRRSLGTALPYAAA
jgi:hypothetical protein